MRRLLAAMFFVLSISSVSLAQWTPKGNLSSIPVIESCAETGGDIAYAKRTLSGPVIYFCKSSADRINALHPDAGHFYYVHEFGHHALNTDDEARADCWAARQLSNAPNGDHYLQAAIRHFRARGSEYNPRYGTATERADRIARCANETAESRNNEDDTDRPIISHRGFPSPRHKGDLVGGVISDQEAEKYLDIDDDFRWDTSPRNPYLYYAITVRNKGTRSLVCKLTLQIDLKARDTSDMVQRKWNVDEKKFKLKPGETKQVKGKIEWYANSDVMPGRDYDVIAMFDR